MPVRYHHWSSLTPEHADEWNPPCAAWMKAEICGAGRCRPPQSPRTARGWIIIAIQALGIAPSPALMDAAHLPPSACVVHGSGLLGQRRGIAGLRMLGWEPGACRNSTALALPSAWRGRP